MLGPFEVVADGRPLSLGGPRQRSLLAILLLRRGEVVPSDQLIDELWNERPPATAAKTLQGHVSHLRKLLGPNVLITRNGGYLVDVPPEQVDAERFAALVADARAARDPPAARELLGQALGLWRGAPLSDLAYEPFAQGAIARLEAAHLDALEDRLAADLALGRHRALIGELEGLVDAHPERERLLGALMLGLYRSGRQTEALAVYRRGREALQEELGLVPGPELRALERQILDHDPRLKVHETPASRARRRGLIATGVVVVLAAALTAGLAARGHATAIRVQPDSLVAIDATTRPGRGRRARRRAAQCGRGRGRVVMGGKPRRADRLACRPASTPRASHSCRRLADRNRRGRRPRMGGALPERPASRCPSCRSTHSSTTRAALSGSQARCPAPRVRSPPTAPRCTSPPDTVGWRRWTRAAGSSPDQMPTPM